MQSTCLHSFFQRDIVVGFLSFFLSFIFCLFVCLLVQRTTSKVRANLGAIISDFIELLSHRTLTSVREDHTAFLRGMVRMGM